MTSGRPHHGLLSSSLYVVELLRQTQNWVGRKTRRFLRRMLPHLDLRRLPHLAVRFGTSDVARRGLCVHLGLVQGYRYDSNVSQNTNIHLLLVRRVPLWVEWASSAEFQPSAADLLHKVLAGRMEK